MKKEEIELLEDLDEINDVDNLLEYRKKLVSLSEEEKRKHDLQLKRMADGTFQGPPVGYPSIDKPWLKYYEDYDIKQDIPKMSAYDYMVVNNNSNLDKNALNFYGIKITYKGLLKNIDKVTKSLISLGVKKGDIVTLAMANTPEMIYLFYALNRIGAVSNMIDPRYSSDEMKREINKVNSKYFITLEDCYDVSRKIIDETKVEKTIYLSAVESMPLPVRIANKLKNKIKTIDKNSISWEEFIKNGKKITKDINNIYENNMPITIVHTGGTTGEPKGVVLTNENFVSMANMHMHGGLDYEKDDKFLNILPPFIAYCLCNGINMPLTLGLEVTIIPQWNVPDFPIILDKYKPNHVLAGPILWDYVTKSNIKDLSYLKTPVSGGDALNEELEKRINKFFAEKGCKSKVSQGYGMTEVSSAAVFSKQKANKIGSVGIPFIKNTVSIFNPDTLVERRVGEEGEIWISTPTAMKEYYNNEVATKELKTVTVDGKEWVRTGDIGKIDLDGNVYIVGRMKRMIVRNGNKIFPANTENIVLKLDEIDNCAIVGIDDEIERKVPVIHIVLKDGITESKDEIVDKIRNIISENLPEFNIPVKYVFRKSMPLTSINKIDFKKLEQEELSNDTIIDYTNINKKIK